MDILISYFDMPLEDWIKAILAITSIMVFVGLGELIFKFVKDGKRYSRKFVHIFVGITIAFLPFYMPSQQVTVIIGSFFIVANFAAFQLNIFKGMHHKRESLGTIFFPIIFTFLCLVSWSQPWLIVFPVLAMAIGDGMASLVGENVRNPRQLFSEIKGKSVQGSSTVFLTVIALLSIYSFVIMGEFPTTLLILAIVVGGVVATIAEIVAWSGSDNITLPLFTWVVLRFIEAGQLEIIIYTFILVLAIAILSIKIRFLSQDGGLALILLGFFMFTIGGIPWTIPIISFFIASSMLSKLPLSEERKIKKAEKGSRRDATQVFANGLIPAILLLVFWLTKNHMFYDLHIIALTGATADTWATEIGGRFGNPHPFHLRLFRKVPAGTSGAVSILGFLGSFAGGAFIGLVASSWTDLGWLIGGFSGILISVFDSVLGAYLQKQYVCPECGELLEKPFHCNNLIDDKAKNLYGWQLLNNNKVNMLSIGLGCVLAFVTLF